MKVLILCGSGNKSGTTFSMCQIFSAEMSKQGCAVEMEDLSDYSFGDCIGCRCCKSGKGCSMSDDMDLLYRKLESAEMLVFASPIRFNGPSSIMKRFMDRLNPYWYSERLHPLYSCALLCAGSSEPRFDNAISELKAVSKTLGMKWLGGLCVKGTDSSELDPAEIIAFSQAVLGLKND